jgi:hypothetical protein
MLSPTLWIIPHAYIWMMKAIRLRRRQYRGLEETSGNRYEMSAADTKNSKTSYEPVYTFDNGANLYQSSSQFQQYQPEHPSTMPPAYHSGPSGQNASNESDIESLLAEYNSMHGPPGSAKEEQRRREMLRKHPERIDQFRKILSFMPGLKMDGHPHSARIMYGALALATLSILMWILTFANVVMHWESGSPKARGYYLDARVSANPSAVGTNIPDSCTSWLGSTDLGALGFFNMDTDHYLARLLPTALFILTWRTIVLSLLNLVFTDRSKPSEDGKPPKSTEGLIASELKWFIALVPFALLCAALASAAWVVVEDLILKHGVMFKYTNDVTKTGGCTWGMVEMDKRWGFWDVKEGILGLRILLAAAGVAA